MQTSWNGLCFIAQREALVTVSYVDGKHEDGSPKYSIGFGSQTGAPKPGDTITIEEAFKRLREDIESRDLTIGHLIKVPIRQCEWDAVASLYYQGGIDPLRAVAKMFNDRPSIFALTELAKWNFGNPGLAKRRIREMAMGLDGYYGKLEEGYPFYDGNPRTTDKQMRPFPEEGSFNQ